MIDLLGAAAGATLWATQLVKARRFVPPPPMLALSGAPSQHVLATVSYNGHKRADIWAPENAVAAPVVVFVPGGGWVAGYRRPQGYALMQKLVEAGWICVAIDYRTSPQHRWPAHFHDVRDALNWTRANIAAYGGDPNFVAVAGASAGGHMASLAGLAWDKFGIRRKPDAVVALYGVYDWRPRRTPMSRFLQALVVDDHHLEKASPIVHVREDAPPCYLIHGDEDRLVPVRGAHKFYNALRHTSKETVDYEEIVGVGHAFDLTDPIAASGVADELRASRNSFGQSGFQREASVHQGFRRAPAGESCPQSTEAVAAVNRVGTPMNVNDIAAFLYGSFANGYANSWATAPNKLAWRRTAAAVINAIERGVL